jgi:predicted lipoprotein with Yx(FWY)xxD motif
LIAALAAVTVAALATGMAGAHTSAAKLQLRKTDVGTILVNGRGFTIYAFTKDGRNRDACASVSGCLKVWPIVGGSAKPVLGPGVKRSLLGSITIKGGARQLTYAAHPLYTYVADSGPGETSYVNFLQFGGRWPALNAAGREVK